MAKKQSIVESDSDGSQELTETQTTKKPLAAMKPSASKAPQPPPSSESGSETESESDKDSPIPTQAKEKSESKPSAADPVKSAAKKRRAAEGKETNARDAKKKSKAEPESSKKSKNQRVWSEPDEIVILQGMVDYWGKFKADPTADYEAFSAYIKKNLNKKDPSKRQLQDKISKLKKKYQNNKMKEEKDGKEITFSQHHEKTLYELSKSVWGTDKEDDKAEADAETEPAKDKAVAAVEKERVGAKKFENGIGDDREKQWKKMRLEELQLNVRLLEVKTAQARLLIECFKSEEGL